MESNYQDANGSDNQDIKPLVPRPRPKIIQNDNKIDVKIFVGQIPQDWREQEVTKFFSDFGQILESQIIINPRTGQPDSCAFVQFQSMTEAQRAIQKLDKQTLPGSNLPIVIKWANGEQERLGVSRESEPQLFIGSLPKQCSQQNLKDLFSPFGEFNELHIMKDHDGRSQGCAFIQFQHHQSALLASRKLNAKAHLPHSDRPIQVRYAQRKEVRPPPGPTNNNNYKPPPFVPQIQVPPPNNNQQYLVFMDEASNYTYTNYVTREQSTKLPPPGSILVFPDGVNKIVAEPAPQPAPPGANLFIFHLPNSFSNDDLHDLFKTFGRVISAQIMCQQDGQSQGFGFVGYQDPESANLAIQKLNGFPIDGQKLKVQIKQGDGQENINNARPSVGLNQVQFNPY